MSSLDRSLSGDVLVFDLTEERRIAADPALLARSGRNARTLLKTDALRVTLVVIGSGGEIPEHKADGPITVQPLQGELRFITGDNAYELKPGQLLSLGAGIPHRVSSALGAAFLLTVSLAKPTEG